MSLKDLELKFEYRSTSDDLVNDFYVPCLMESVKYQRAVGFFSSTALAEIADGIEDLASRDGRIELVASPILSAEDIEAMERGYQSREEVIGRSLDSHLTPPSSDDEEYRLNLLANLIADGLMDVKIALLNNSSRFGMYHEKLGLFADAEGNAIAFDGSLNESETAISLNCESINVYFSWRDPEGRYEAKRRAIGSIWRGTLPGVETIDYPQAAEQIVKRFYTSKVDYASEAARVRKLWAEKTSGGRRSGRAAISLPRYLGDRPFLLQDYQKEAIEAWLSNGMRGIFDMATGTGKTYTGLGAAVGAYQANDRRLALFIICPYQHLVEQWLEDLALFGAADPIVCYSGSKHGDWRKRLRDAIYSYTNNRPGKEFFCCISTNATFAGKDFQKLLGRLRGRAMLMADEVHNMGARTYKEALSERFDCRLGLTATLDRHFDDVGTSDLIAYFGKRCIEYPIDRAISEGKLCHYRYYPILCYLSDNELEEYERLSLELRRCWSQDKKGEKRLSERGKKIAMARARVVAGASSKVRSLEKVIEREGYADKRHILVYCGATQLLEGELADPSQDARQIKVVIRMLYERFGMRVSAFTSEENIAERGVLKEKFAEGDLQALVAIRCLDEGVNIPNIHTAFMLASTTNPKEYIQRRGRLLRKAEGKRYSVIYDFVTLPRRLGELEGRTSAQKSIDVSLVRNELARMEEFARVADNYAEAKRVINDIMGAYHLDTIGEFDYEEGGQ